MRDILQSGKQPLNFSRGAYPSTLTIHNFDEDSFVYHSLMTRKRSNRFKCQPLGDRTILDKWLNIFVTITARCAYNLLFRVLGFCFVTSRHVRGWSNDGNNDRGFFWLRLIRIDNGDGSFGLNAESHLFLSESTTICVGFVQFMRECLCCETGRGMIGGSMAHQPLRITTAITNWLKNQ